MVRRNAGYVMASSDASAGSMGQLDFVIYYLYWLDSVYINRNQLNVKLTYCHIDEFQNL